LIEILFPIRASFTSVKVLIAAIKEFMVGQNDHCHLLHLDQAADEFLSDCHPNKEISSATD
jgi:hypothetical protein